MKDSSFILITKNLILLQTSLQFIAIRSQHPKEDLQPILSEDVEVAGLKGFQIVEKPPELDQAGRESMFDVSK